MDGDTTACCFTASMSWIFIYLWDVFDLRPSDFCFLITHLDFWRWLSNVLYELFFTLVTCSLHCLSVPEDRTSVWHPAKQNIASVSGTMYSRCWVISWLVWKMINEGMKRTTCRHVTVIPSEFQPQPKPKPNHEYEGDTMGEFYSLLKLLWDSLLFQTKQRSLF